MQTTRTLRVMVSKQKLFEGAVSQISHFHEPASSWDMLGVSHCAWCSLQRRAACLLYCSELCLVGFSELHNTVFQHRGDTLFQFVRLFSLWSLHFFTFKSGSEGIKAADLPVAQKRAPVLGELRQAGPFTLPVKPQ